MKKTLAVLLALAMLICTLTACGNNGNAANSPSNAPSGTNSSDAPGGDAGIYDKLELTTATSYNETDFSGSLIKWFGDYLNEKSGGAVTLKCYYGGAFCQDAEVYDYVMSGDMNLSFVQPVYCMTYFPYAFGIASGISDENCCRPLIASSIFSFPCKPLSVLQSFITPPLNLYCYKIFSNSANSCTT